MNYINSQPIINIGCLGSVSDGKSTLIAKLTGIKTQKHSDELKRNITINQGYGNLKIFYDNVNYYTTDSTGNISDCELVNHISFVDCPGHQELIQTMLSSIVLMDGAIVVIAANQPLLQKPQLIQHLAAIKLGKINKIIICMNKIDLVSKEDLLERKLELDKMLNEYDIKPFAIIPTCFNKNINMKYVIKAIMELFNPQEYITRSNSNPLFRISRSFDINKAGTCWNQIVGGVIGGSLFNGKLSIGDNIEIKPGHITKNKDGKFTCTPIISTIISIKTDTTELNEIIPGGLIGIGTDLDPYYCKHNNLSGQIVGKIGTLPDIVNEITLKLNIITMFGFNWIPKLKDQIMLQIGTKICEALLLKINDDNYTFTLIKPYCVFKDQHIIICYMLNKVLKIVGEGYLI
jgi:translation initiation factor 2 subunit 3